RRERGTRRVAGGIRQRGALTQATALIPSAGPRPGSEESEPGRGGKLRRGEHLEAVRGPVEAARGRQPLVDRDALADPVGERGERDGPDDLAPVLVARGRGR